MSSAPTVQNGSAKESCAAKKRRGESGRWVKVISRWAGGGRKTGEVNLAMRPSLYEIADVVHERNLDTVVNFKVRRDAAVNFVCALPLDEIRAATAPSHREKIDTRLLAPLMVFGNDRWILQRNGKRGRAGSQGQSVRHGCVARAATAQGQLLVAKHAYANWTDRLIVVPQNRVTSLGVAFPLVLEVVPVEVVRTHCEMPKKR